MGTYTATTLHWYYCAVEESEIYLRSFQISLAAHPKNSAQLNQ